MPAWFLASGGVAITMLGSLAAWVATSSVLWTLATVLSLFLVARTTRVVVADRRGAARD